MKSPRWIIKFEQSSVINKNWAKQNSAINKQKFQFTPGLAAKWIKGEPSVKKGCM